jgi:nicotinate-nucleotide adenylyltransferase
MNLNKAGARVGVLGGTFDPIHAGHIAAARAARDAFGLSQVLLIPSNVPPHRRILPTASPFHRFGMTALAVSSMDAAFLAGDDELRAAGPSYTADTLTRLHERGWSASQLFFITGADAFAEIGTWKRYPEVLELANFVVVARPGQELGALPARLPELTGRMLEAEDTPASSAGTVIFLLDAPTPDVSSTLVRERLARGESITGLVPPLVERHILHHGLYTRADQ